MKKTGRQLNAEIAEVHDVEGSRWDWAHVLTVQELDR